MTTHLHRTLAVASVLLGFAPAIALAQQETTIHGRVTSETSVPVQGAIVNIPGLSLGAYTDASGNYSFNVPGRFTGQTATLTARRIGFQLKSATVTLNGGSITHDFQLTAAPTQLTGMVVTALGLTREK